MFKLDPALRAGIYQVNDVIERAARNTPAGSVTGAYLLYIMRDMPTITARDKINLTTLAGRIATVTPSDPRFSHYDYADAVVNMTRTVSVEKLLELEDDAFEAALNELALYKRETYSDAEHASRALDLNVYAEV